MGTIQIDGSTPKLTIGNATAEDALIVFDGNAQDYYIALDDSADDLLIGLGSTVGTTPIISLTESGAVTMKNVGTGDNNPMVLTLQTSEADMAQDDVIGKIAFQAPDEGTGTDAILVSAAIQARAEGDHSSSSNATSIDFLTGASEAAAKKLSITSAGHFIPGADNTYDIGTSSLEFKDGYFDGTLYCDTLNLAGTNHTSISAGLTGIDDQSSSNDDQITISDSAVIINEDSDDLDFRVESNSNTHALFIDGDADSRVQVGSATSVASASITSDLQVTKANGFPAISINAFKGDDTTGALVFTKSRNTTVGSSTIVADNDPLGKIIFAADDGSDYVSIGAEIKAMINGTPGGNDVPTELIFSTTADGSSNPTGRMYIAATGYVGVADSAPEYYFNVKYNQKTEGTTSGAGLVRFTADNSATNSTNWGWQATYNDSAFMANDANNPAFKFHNSGIGYADLTWNDNAFDYAELFKWKTPLDSDNAVEALWGMSVVLDGDFVRIAEAGEEDLILGVVRPKGTTASHGDGCHWQGKYLKDVWGKYLTENYTKVMWNDQVTGRLHSYHSDEIPAYELDAFAFARDTPNHYLKEENFKLNGKGQKIPIIVPSTAEEKSATNYTEINHEDNDPSKLLQRRRYNPDYDEDIKYIMREDRPREWVLIGLLGQVPVKDTAIIPTHWRLMKNLESGLDKYLIFNK
ncbi:hypothetical protein N9091_00420 [bacterium]|nr:hypothetical protein [bacterium]